MKTLKMVGLALIAVLAIGAMASASASALSFKTVKAEEEVTGLAQGTLTLESLGQTSHVECPDVHIRGFVLNGTDLVDKVLFHFLNCKETAFNSSCTSPGGATGLILTLELHGLLVWVLLSNGKRDPGLLVRPASGTHLATFSCDGGLVTFKVTGSVLALYTGELNKLKSEFNFKFAKKGTEVGMQEFTEWSTSETGGTLSNAHLTTEATGLLKFTAEGAEVAEGAVKTTGGEGEIKNP